MKWCLLWKIKASFVTHGTGFLVWAILMDLLDEVLLPALLAFAGYPALGALALVLDLDWLTYPLYFVLIFALKKSSWR